MTSRPTLLFVSPQFLFPMDAGGKIRSANLLKHLKGGAFATRLLSPATADEEARWRNDVGALADETALYRPSPKLARRLRRLTGFLTPTPISAFVEAGGAAKRAIREALAQKPDLVVFDYVQSLALVPARIEPARVVFAHNVETEILERHAKAATGLMRSIWRREAKKMRRFEKRACVRADGVIAVSDRDVATFRDYFGAKFAAAIPTGVDADYFSWQPPADRPEILFTGSMDWKANEDGLLWFMEHVWPTIVQKRPDAAFVAVGRNPPRPLIEAVRKRGINWRFTGFVEDVREHARGAVSVIPLRVGGGTRIKAFEAMAVGTPVVSTARGVEGLPVTAGEHFLEADEPADFAAAVISLLDDGDLRLRLSGSARKLVEENFSHRAAAREFERHCLAVLSAAR